MSKQRVKKSFIYRLSFLCLATAILLLSSSFAQATSYYWVDSSTTGDWSNPASWGGTVPTSSDNAYVALTGAIANITQPGAVCTSVYVGYTGLGTGYVSMTGGDLTQYIGGNCQIGITNDGTFNQSAGTYTTGVGGITLGGTYTGGVYYFNTGNYNLSGNAILNCQGGLIVGQYGTGYFTQNGGTNKLYSSLTSAWTNMTIGYYFPTGNQSVGTYTLNSGSLSANQISLAVYGKGEFDQNGGTVTLMSTTNGLSFASQTNSIGTYDLYGGTLNLKFLKKGNGTAYFNFGLGTLQAGAAFSSSVNMNLNGASSVNSTVTQATVDTAGVPVTLSGILSGSSGLNKVGSGTLTLSNANSYTGETDVQVGTLSVTGSLSSIGSVVVSPNAILAGIGSVGLVTVNAGGHIAPGVSGVGTLTDTGLTLASGAVLDYDLGTPAASDLISMSASTLALNGQQFTDFNFNPSGSFGPGVYTLIDAGTITGSLGSTVSGQIAGLNAYLSVNYANNDLVLNVVPEPGTFAMLITACLAMLGYAGRVYRRKN
ncbi:MAG: autotransporter-associated beta strand repeat-containing protein [Thermoguttaceae bacterium]